MYEIMEQLEAMREKPAWAVGRSVSMPSIAKAN